MQCSGGVLKFRINGLGTYVINKQTPNMQLWLSSPISGPQRYEFAQELGAWINNRTFVSLDDLLNSEF